MAKTKLSAVPNTIIARGYGQVEPNHLSAQKTGQIYAQLPAASTIEILENGQFAKYDYANGVVDFTGAGEWMLVFNEVKVYRDYEGDCDFAMKKADYLAKVYSPIDSTSGYEYQTRDYSKITTPADEYEPDSTTTPFKNSDFKTSAKMPTDTVMVPRLFKTNVGDIFTTNMVVGTLGDSGTLQKAVLLEPRTEDGVLAVVTAATAGKPTFEIAKIYTLADGQPAVKVMRIA